LDTLAALTVDELLDLVADEAPAPGSGSAAALTAAAAAALVVMASRRSYAIWPEAPGIAAQALIRRQRCLELATLDAEAFETALTALERREDVGERLRDTVDVLLALANAAADIAELAALAADRSDVPVRPDAAAAALLAESAVRVAGALIRVNLVVTPRDEALRGLELAEGTAARAARRAVEIA
jgi:formiminotetrahydrofolate cyclodeaminase